MQKYVLISKNRLVRRSVSQAVSSFRLLLLPPLLFTSLFLSLGTGCGAAPIASGIRPDLAALATCDAPISDRQVAMLQIITERIHFESHNATAALLGFEAFPYNYDICPLNVFDKRPSFTIYMQKDKGLFVVSFKGSQDTYADVIADFNNVSEEDKPLAGGLYLPPGPAGFRGKLLKTGADTQIKSLFTRQRRPGCRAKVVLAGHSLGGSLAMLMASYLDGVRWQKDGSGFEPELGPGQVDRVVTFGAPPYVKKGGEVENDGMQAGGIRKKILDFYDAKVVNYISNADFIPFSYNISGQGSGSVAEGALDRTGVAPAVFRHVGAVERIGLSVGDVPPCPHDMLSYVVDLGFAPAFIDPTKVGTFYEKCDYSRLYWQEWMSLATYTAAGTP